MWGKAVLVGETETTELFDDFVENFVVGHMQNRFLKTFGVPKATFGNRFFHEDAVYFRLDMRISHLITQATHVETVVLYGSPEEVEAHRMRGETRRKFRDVFVDDWHPGCAIVIAEGKTLYMFCEPKGEGVIVRTVRTGPEPEIELTLVDNTLDDELD